MTSDLDWRPLAEASRQALELLGYSVPLCLPGEEQACGGTYAQHSAAQLAAVHAVADHHLSHLSPPDDLTIDTYMAITAEVEDDCQREGCR